MNYKGLIFSIFSVTIALGSANAQPIDQSFYNYATDTIVLKKGQDPAKLLAERVAIQKRKHVPFANDTAYFGGQLDYINNYTRKYLSSHNRTFVTVKERSKEVFPLIDNVLTQENIPTELKYLAVIESALNRHARSRVGAVGPWQFMSYTGREMGLVVNSRRDDRKDWVRSTKAAAKYLNILYEDLNDWLLVVAAYNSGPRPVIRAINRTGSTSFWDIKQYLPRETQGHVLAFVATATSFEKLDHYIGNDVPDNLVYDKKLLFSAPKKEVKVSPFTQEELKNMAIVKLTEPIKFELMATELGMDIDILNKWNGDYELFEFNSYPTPEYRLRIPKDKLDKFILQKDILSKRSKEIYDTQNM